VSVAKALRALLDEMIVAINAQRNSPIDLVAIRLQKNSPTDRRERATRSATEHHPKIVVAIANGLSVLSAPEAYEKVTDNHQSPRVPRKAVEASAGQNLPVAQVISAGQRRGHIDEVPDTLSSSLTLT